MKPDELLPPAAPVNRLAVVSGLTGLLTLISFCIAVAPVPLTGYVCYPAAVLLGLVALISGAAALAQVRRTGEQGRAYALLGVWVGGLAMLASACAISIGILLFPHVIALLHQYIK